MRVLSLLSRPPAEKQVMHAVKKELTKVVCWASVGLAGSWGQLRGTWLLA